MNLSVVVPAFNEEKYLPDTIRAIQEAVRFCDVEAEILVADDDSTDGTAGIAQSLGARVVRSGKR